MYESCRLTVESEMQKVPLIDQLLFIRLVPQLAKVGINKGGKQIY